MNVALVHDFLLEYGGAERFLEALMRMFPEAPIYTLCYDPTQFPQSWQKKTIIPLCRRYPFIARYPQLYSSLLTSMVESLNLSAYDLVFSSDVIFAKMVLTLPTTKHICYQHTPANMLYSFLNSSESRSVLSFLLTGYHKAFFAFA
jgi:hypothetical protein